MSTESSLDFNEGSKITLLYEDVESESIISTTGYIKNVDSQNIVLHNRLKDVSINFNVETKSGKKLDKSDNNVSEINIKTFREWEFQNELHIVLPTANDIKSNNTYPITVTGSLEGDYNIDFRNIKFNLNGHSIGVMNQKGGSEWMITDIKSSNDNNDKIVSCGFYNEISDYDVIYIATNFKTSVFSIDKLNR